MIRFLLIAGFCLINISANAARYECPPSVTVREEAVDNSKDFLIWSDTYKAPPAQGAATTKHNFQTLQISDGPPNERAWLKPDEEKHGAIWSFLSTNTKLTWLSCYYEGTRIIMSKELPNPVISCKNNSAEPRVVICEGK